MRAIFVPKDVGGQDSLAGQLYEKFSGLCSRTALHAASNFGHTATVVALVKAGADVHCKDIAGYGSTGCILVPLGCHMCGLDGPSSQGSAA